MGMSEDIGKKQAGRYKWTSEADADGDVVSAENARGYDGVKISAGKPNKGRAGLLPPEEAREFALAILNILDGNSPEHTTPDPRGDGLHD